VAACASPSIRACEDYAETVGNALSVLVASITPYRVDGRVGMLPDGIKLVASEFWQLGATRTAATCLDDCEGSGTATTTMLYEAEAVARDPKASAAYPTTAAVANALALHDVGIGVLAANAGHAAEAGDHGADAVAGHAIAMALPKAHVFRAMVDGLKECFADKGAAFCAERSMALAQAAVPEPLLARFSPEDAQRLRGPKALAEFAQASSLEALAIEGTSPVSPTILYSDDGDDRTKRMRRAARDAALMARLGSAVAVAQPIVQLDVSPNGPNHGFYKSFVEFLLPPTSEFYTSPALRAAGAASSHVVFASETDMRVAGATPKELAAGAYALRPLYTVNEHEATLVDAATRRARAHTMPRRADAVEQLHEEGAAGYAASLGRLRALAARGGDGGGATGGADGAETQTTTFVVAQAALVHNPSAVALFASEVGALVDAGAVAVRVRESAMPGVFESEEDGSDVGVFALVDVVHLKAL
jgi:hypothetical protein